MILNGLGERHLLLGEHLDPVPHHIDPSVIGRVQLEHGVLSWGRGGAWRGRIVVVCCRPLGPMMMNGDIPVLACHAESAHRLLELPTISVNVGR